MTEHARFLSKPWCIWSFFLLCEKLPTGFSQGDCPASVTPIITQGLLFIPPTVLVIPPPYPMCQRHPSLRSNLTLQHDLHQNYSTQLVVDFLQQHLERHSSLTYEGTLMIIISTLEMNVTNQLPRTQLLHFSQISFIVFWVNINSPKRVHTPHTASFCTFKHCKLQNIEL